MIDLHVWSEDDLPLLVELNAPDMTKHLGGPESDERLRQRHERYLRLTASDAARMFTIWVEGERAGSIGFWEKTWREEPIYETGWAILTRFQGRGIATVAARAIVERARAERRRRSLHAFPGVENVASNAICRKAGFTLVVECDFEYPPGRLMRCNDWRVDLA